MTDVSVVIVTWNSSRDIRRCLDSIAAHRDGLHVEIIVVDNASADGTAAIVHDEYPWVRLVGLTENIGFPRANNLGFSVGRSRYILILNPDTELHAGAISGPVRFLDETPEYGCVGLKTLLPDGRIQFHCARQFVSLVGAVAGHFYLDKIFRSAKVLRSPDMPFWDHADSRDVDMIQGAYMMVRRSLLDRIGYFDEQIPMFLEDVELCLRIWRSGSRIRYMTEYDFVHHVGQSTKQAPPMWISCLRLDAWYLFIREYEGGARANLFALVVLFGFPLQVLLSGMLGLVASLRHRRSMVRAYLLPTMASVPWAFGRLRRALFA